MRDQYEWTYPFPHSLI